MALFSVQFSALHYFIYSVYTNLNYNRMFSTECTFQISLQISIKILQSVIFTTSVVHNISIATDDDVIQFGYDVNIYPVYLSRAIIIFGDVTEPKMAALHCFQLYTI